MRFRHTTLDKLNHLASEQGMSKTALVDKLILDAWDRDRHSTPVQTSQRKLNRRGFNEALGLLDKASGFGSNTRLWKLAAINVHDTFDLACRAMESVVGQGFSDADALTLLKMMMDEKARLEGGE
jgi:hypothetical protein